MYKLETFTFDDAGEDSLRLTTRVLNPDQTGYMGHTIVARSGVDSFWQGAESALTLANKHTNVHPESLDFKCAGQDKEQETIDDGFDNDNDEYGNDLTEHDDNYLTYEDEDLTDYEDDEDEDLIDYEDDEYDLAA